MRKTLSFALALVSLLFLCFGGAEAFAGACHIGWTVGCLLVAALSACLAVKINPEIDMEEEI